MPRGTASAPRTNPYILSYSDLMAALLLLFILLLTATLFRLQSEVDLHKDQAQRITVVKYKIIEELKKAFADQGVQIEIDETTGAIKLPSDILFATGSSELQPEGRERIHFLFPIYLSVLLDDQFSNDVKQIIVEGHTDPTPQHYKGRYDYQGAYIYNLGLSLDRAESVVKDILNSDLATAGRTRGLNNLENADTRLKGLLTANGLSFSRPVDKDGEVISDVPYDEIAKGEPLTPWGIDFDKCRRVEFKFRLNDEQYLREIHDLLKETMRGGGN